MVGLNSGTTSCGTADKAIHKAENNYNLCIILSERE